MDKQTEIVTVSSLIQKIDTVKLLIADQLITSDRRYRDPDESTTNKIYGLLGPLSEAKFSSSFFSRIYNRECSRIKYEAHGERESGYRAPRRRNISDELMFTYEDLNAIRGLLVDYLDELKPTVD